MKKSTTVQRERRPKKQGDAEKRAEVIFECLKRNPKVKEIKDKLKSDPSFFFSDDYRKELREIIELPILADFVVGEATFKKHSVEFIKYFKRSTIEILYPGLPRRISTPPYTDLPIFLPPELTELFGLSPIKAIDRKRKAITIRLRLNRSDKMIKKDIENLLKLMRKEAEQSNLKLETSKPHWEKLRDYIKIYDLREQGKGWEEIASKVFKVKGTAKDLERAAGKARKGYDKAKEVINAGWRQL